MTDTSSPNWHAETVSRIRALMKEADPDVIEERKWQKPSNPQGNLVWYDTGMICTCEEYKHHLRLTFSKGQALREHDPKGLINNFRAMTIQEGEKLDEEAFVKLIKMAVVLNREGKSAKKAN